LNTSYVLLLLLLLLTSLTNTQPIYLLHFKPISQLTPLVSPVMLTRTWPSRPRTGPRTWPSRPRTGPRTEIWSLRTTKDRGPRPRTTSLVVTHAQSSTGSSLWKSQTTHCNVHHSISGRNWLPGSLHQPLSNQSSALSPYFTRDSSSFVITYQSLLHSYTWGHRLLTLHQVAWLCQLTDCLSKFI